MMCLDENGYKPYTCACDRPPVRIYSPDNVNLVYDVPYLAIDEYGNGIWIYPSDVIIEISTEMDTSE